MADIAHGVERVTHWLEERGVDYELVEHARTLSAADEPRDWRFAELPRP